MWEYIAPALVGIGFLAVVCVLVGIAGFVFDVVQDRAEAKRNAELEALEKQRQQTREARKLKSNLLKESEVMFDRIFLGDTPTMPLDSQAGCGCDSEMLETRIEKMAKRCELALEWDSDNSADCMDRLNTAIGALLNEYEKRIKPMKLAKQFEQRVLGTDGKTYQETKPSDDSVIDFGTA